MKRRHHAPWWVFVSDSVLIVASMILAYWMRYTLRWFRDVDYDHPLSAYVPFILFFLGSMLLAFQIDQVYQNWRGRSWLDQVYSIINAAAKSIVILFALTFFLDIFQPLQYSRALFLQAGLIVIVLLSIARILQNAVVGWLRTRGIGVARVIIVGAGEVGRTVMRTIVARPEFGYQIVGFVDDNPQKGESDIGRFKALGALNNLPQLIEEASVDEVIVTLPWMYHRKIMAIVRECQRREVGARIVPDLFQMSLSQVDVDDLGGLPLIGVREVGFRKSNLMIKRALDVTVAVTGLLLGAPLWILIALVIKIDSPGPIFFRQTRVGARGKLFEIYKFRSMHEGAEEEVDKLRNQNEADGPLFKIHHDPRLTRVGKILRRSSLDELPQLWNILRGEMSLVGPRPALPCEVESYLEWHKRRLEVRPGLTGLWQVSGRSELTFGEGVLLDIYYIENWSVWLDLKIILRTAPQLLLGNGAY
ncbi:MAG TPA: undecaprenyl-phosphate glucose phosphotransferase [Chloroflexi bacterium]|nr:undecaprenyl-phosphate glucose phosphotransferase [Chloroflexota bacterium]